MRYQIELGPRIPSTRMSVGCSAAAAFGWRERQTSRASIASSRVLVRATSISGLLPFGGFSAGPSSSASAQQPVQRSDRVVHCRPGVTAFGEPGRHGGDGERRGPAAGNLVPRQRRRNPGVRRRPHRIGGGDRPVLGVLVEVDEHALPVFLPPPAGGQLRGTALHLAGHRLGGQPHLLERPVRSDAGVDVEAARPGGLGPGGQAVVLEHLARHLRHVEDLRPVHAGHRVEVDAQLVGMVQIARAHRMRVEVDAAEVDRPHQAGRAGGSPPPWPRCPCAYRSSATSIQSGRFSGARFWKIASSVMPLTNRLRIIGRSTTPRSAPSATDR